MKRIRIAIDVVGASLALAGHAAEAIQNILPAYGGGYASGGVGFAFTPQAVIDVIALGYEGEPPAFTFELYRAGIWDTAAHCWPLLSRSRSNESSLNRFR